MYRKCGELNLQTLVDNLEFTEVKDHTLFGRIPKVGLTIETDYQKLRYEIPTFGGKVVVGKVV